MANKYLTLEEAAAQLGVTEDALKDARTKGDIRGFADRGNWKFREEDIAEYGRTLSADSSPDVALFADEDNVLGDDDGLSEQPTEIRKGDNNLLSDEDDILITDADGGASDSGVRMVLDDDLLEVESSDEAPPLLSDPGLDPIALQLSDDSEESVEIGLEGESSADLRLSLDDSDSDVKLAAGLDDQPLSDSSEEVFLGQDSDSDVRLLGETAPMLDAGSDSDVRLIKTDSDSDVQLVGSNSDSDVRLLSPEISTPDSDSDVKLSRGDTEVAISLGDEEGSGVALAEDSGISLDAAIDSGISLDMADDSGIALDMADDSGIALDVAGDSGIALDTGDSDLSLDEGLTLDTGSDSGISLDGSDTEATAPVMDFSDDDASATGDTMVAIPALGDDDSESDFELGALEGDAGSDTSVLLFDDEDDADDRAATMIKKSTDDQEETFDLDAGDAFDEDFEDEDDLLGEDDEIEDFADDDSFMADDDAFDEGSFADEAASTGQIQMVAATEQEWGGFMFATVLVSSVAMLFCCGVLFDLIRFTWKAGEYGVVSGWFIELVGK